MPNRWITFVKNWASSNNIAYGCALSKPELKAAYNKEYPKAIKLPKGVKKLEESKPPADVKSKATYPNLKIRIPEEQENIQFDIEEMDKKAKKGRPKKYVTDEDKYKAKLESNKLKRREARAAKKVAGSGNFFVRDRQPPPPPPPPPLDPLKTGIENLPELPKNLIRDFIPNKVKREPQRDQQSRAGIQALTVQLNTQLPNEDLYDYQRRRQKIYPQIAKLLKKIVNRTPQEEANVNLDATSGLFKSNYFSGF